MGTALGWASGRVGTVRPVRLGVQAAMVDGRIVGGDVEVVDGVVAAVGLGGEGRGPAAPGFVDLQVNGFAGVDFLSADHEFLGEMPECEREVIRLR
jgi:hypothetical protein